MCFCLKTKISKPSCRIRADAVAPKAQNFGHLITVDFQVPSEERESQNSRRRAVVAHDWATQWIQFYPCNSKSRDLEKLIFKEMKYEERSPCKSQNWDNACTTEFVLCNSPHQPSVMVVAFHLMRCRGPTITTMAVQHFQQGRRHFKGNCASRKSKVRCLLSSTLQPRRVQQLPACVDCQLSSSPAILNKCGFIPYDILTFLGAKNHFSSGFKRFSGVDSVIFGLFLGSSPSRSFDLPKP